MCGARDCALPAVVRARGCAASSSAFRAMRASPSAIVDQRRAARVVDVAPHRAEPALVVRERARRTRSTSVPSISGSSVKTRERREQRRVHLERRVLRRRADQRDRAVLDVRQDDVLLRLVEAVDLVDEEDRALRRARPGVGGFGHHASQVRHARRDGGERLEVRPGRRGDDPRERRLARARAAPRGSATAGGPPRSPRRSSVPVPDDVLLPDELVERARPHPRRQRSVLLGVHIAS